MSRTVKIKNLNNARMLKEYASWIYCTSCEKTVAYLCYVTYDAIDLAFTCSCGAKGSVVIEFGELEETQKSPEPLALIKNRLCCPKDKAALITFVEKNLKGYDCKISCLKCKNEYRQRK